jgi:GNAT superfamily N-acetyltransferase
MSAGPREYGADGVRYRVSPAATVEDAATAAQVMGEALHELAASRWLVPDPAARGHVLSDVFGLLTAHALTYGHLDLAFGSEPSDDSPREMIGAAVWIPHDLSQPVPALPGYAQRLRAAAGQNAPRFTVLGELFEEHRPEVPHHHLALLGVAPPARGGGVGSALLRHRHAVLDAAGLPAYLEAAGSDSRRLYRRHGYAPLRRSFLIPDGSSAFYPLWRGVGVSSA